VIRALDDYVSKRSAGGCRDHIAYLSVKGDVNIGTPARCIQRQEIRAATGKRRRVIGAIEHTRGLIGNCRACGRRRERAKNYSRKNKGFHYFHTSGKVVLTSRSLWAAGLCVNAKFCN
jgi:hypothetical protein